MPTEATAPPRADQGGALARPPHAAGAAAGGGMRDDTSEPTERVPTERVPAAEPAPATERVPAVEPPPARERAPAGAPAPVSERARGKEPAPASEPARSSLRGGRRVKPYIVVVAMDLSEPGGRAWRFAFELAALRGETEIHAVVVGPRQVAPAVRDVTTPGASSPPSLRVLQHRFADGQPRLMAMHFRTGRPDRAIISLARELSADLIVVATHPQSSFQRLFGGSTADRIARNAPCPVVVVRPKEDDDADAAEYDPRLR
ncbi:universal stress protein [Sorangium sp. So ce233]|uniref:universal stress protein n=1 Tax=Sorangium sp. So ce233 TaxID=3133290 RepID=UPI003F6299D8